MLTPVLTTRHHSASWIQSTTLPKFLITSILYYPITSSKRILPFRFSGQKYVSTSERSHACYTHRYSWTLSVISLIIKILTLLSIIFYPASQHFVPRRLKYFSCHPVRSDPGWASSHRLVWETKGYTHTHIYTKLWAGCNEGHTQGGGAAGLQPQTKPRKTKI